MVHVFDMVSYRRQLSSNSRQERKCEMFLLYDFPVLTISDNNVITTLNRAISVPLCLLECLFAVMRHLWSFLCTVLDLEPLFCCFWKTAGEKIKPATSRKRALYTKGWTLTKIVTCLSGSCTVDWFLWILALAETTPVLIRPQWWEEHVFSAQQWLLLYSTRLWQPTRHHNRSSDSFLASQPGKYYASSH